MLYVLEGKDANGKVILRAEYDNPLHTNAFAHEFGRNPLVKRVRLVQNDAEVWENEV